jgi:hypothetical protein
MYRPESAGCRRRPIPSKQPHRSSAASKTLDSLPTNVMLSENKGQKTWGWSAMVAQTTEKVPMLKSLPPLLRARARYYFMSLAFAHLQKWAARLPGNALEKGLNWRYRVLPNRRKWKFLSWDPHQMHQFPGTKKALPLLILLRKWPTLEISRKVSNLL